MKLIAVNGRKWSSAGLNAALISSRNSKQPIELLVENAHRFKTYSIDYHDGPRHPHLERVPGRPDLLGDILRSRTAAPMRVSQ
jgi:hypothetical protein